MFGNSCDQCAGSDNAAAKLSWQGCGWGKGGGGEGGGGAIGNAPHPPSHTDWLGLLWLVLLFSTDAMHGEDKPFAQSTCCAVCICALAPMHAIKLITKFAGFLQHKCRAPPSHAASNMPMCHLMPDMNLVFAFLLPPPAVAVACTEQQKSDDHVKFVCFQRQICVRYISTSI